MAENNLLFDHIYSSRFWAIDTSQCSQRWNWAQKKGSECFP